MEIYVFPKAFARHAQLPSSLSSYESMFRNVNIPRTSSLLSTRFTSLGSRAYCTKADHSDPVAQNQTKSNLTKVFFKYVCMNDESQDADSRPIKPLVEKVFEIPSGHTFFEYIEGDVVGWCNLNQYLHSYLVKAKEATESASGQRVSEFRFIEASLFKDPAVTGACWNIIVSELKRSGFDFTEDPVILQKIEEAVERAMTPMTNGIKLNLPVPAGKPDMSAIISWGKYFGPPVVEAISVAPTEVIIRLRHM